MRLLCVLLVSLLACGQPAETRQKEVRDSTNLKAKEVKPAIGINSMAIDYDSSIYVHYIPKHILKLLEKKIPNWQLINPNKWENLWFREYKKDNSLIDYVPADFNCDGKKDYAFILASGKDEMAAWVLLSKGSDYNPIRLQNLESDRKPIDVGLELIPKDRLDYIDLEDESVKSVNISCLAIQVLFFERGAVAYYWNKGKFESVQTGD